MKRFILQTLLIALCAMLFASCSTEPDYYTEYLVVNSSGHDVTMIEYHTVDGWNGDNTPHDVVDSLFIKNGDSMLKSNLFGDLATNFDYMVRSLKLRKDRVRFVFDDGTEKAFFAEVDTAWGPFAYYTGNYELRQIEDEQQKSREGVLWGRLTYTITPEDYEHCKQ